MGRAEDVVGVVQREKEVDAVLVSWCYTASAAAEQQRGGPMKLEAARLYTTERLYSTVNYLLRWSAPGGGKGLVWV